MKKAIFIILGFIVGLGMTFPALAETDEERMTRESNEAIARFERGEISHEMHGVAIDQHIESGTFTAEATLQPDGSFVVTQIAEPLGGQRTVKSTLVPRAAMTVTRNPSTLNGTPVGLSVDDPETSSSNTVKTALVIPNQDPIISPAIQYTPTKTLVSYEANGDK